MSEYQEFRRGWGVVLASMLGIALGLSPLPFYTIGVFAPHLVTAFHWSMASIMGGLSAMTIVVVLMGPVTGWLADRFGVRTVAITSVALFGLAMLSFALQNGSLWVYYGTWSLAAIVGSGTLPVTWTRAINLCFERRKGLALGLALTGTGVAGFLLKPYTAFMIGHFGWRGAYVALALLPLCIALPAAIALFKIKPTILSSTHAPIAQARGIALVEAVRDWRFWLIGAAFLPISFAIGGPIPNMESMLTAHGLTHEQILSIVPFIGFFVVIGRLVGGWLVDRIWAPVVAAVMLSLPATSQILLAEGAVTPTTALLSVAGLGLAAGVEYDLLAFLTARYFGTRHYGAIYGALYGFFAIGAGFASMIYAHIFDVTKTFDGIFLYGALGMVAGALMLFALGPYRFTVDAHEP
jgi:MFS family permease